MSIDEFAKQCQARRQARINALKRLERSGVKLPMSAEDISYIESKGDLVDLDTGEIVKGGATMTATPTEKGKAVANQATIAQRVKRRSG